MGLVAGNLRESHFLKFPRVGSVAGLRDWYRDRRPGELTVSAG